MAKNELDAAKRSEQEKCLECSDSGTLNINGLSCYCNCSRGAYSAYLDSSIYDGGGSAPITGRKTYDEWLVDWLVI